MNLQQQIDYQVWAERVFTNLLEDISAENFHKKHFELRKSLAGIYSHKVEVMWFWFQFVKGLEPYDAPKFTEMRKNELFSEMFGLFREIKEFIQDNPDSSLELDLPWLKQKYPITQSELIYNILNHHTYHRGQIAFIFKDLGLTTPETDYNPYMFTKLI